MIDYEYLWLISCVHAPVRARWYRLNFARSWLRVSPSVARYRRRSFLSTRSCTDIANSGGVLPPVSPTNSPHKRAVCESSHSNPFEKCLIRSLERGSSSRRTKRRRRRRRRRRKRVGTDRDGVGNSRRELITATNVAESSGVSRMIGTFEIPRRNGHRLTVYRQH